MYAQHIDVMEKVARKGVDATIKLMYRYSKQNKGLTQDVVAIDEGGVRECQRATSRARKRLFLGNMG